MGNHLLDTTTPELNGGEFTHTFIYGSWDGEITFYEPMVNLTEFERLRSGEQADECVPIKAPQAWQRAAGGTNCGAHSTVMLCRERWFAPIVSSASGVALSGLYSTRAFTEAAGMAAGEMFTWALVGNVVGIFVLGPLWDYLPARVRAVGSSLFVAAAYASFAVVSGPAGFTAAAFVLGLASSMWIKVFNQADEWHDESIRVRRARGERVAWPTVGLAMLSFGLATSTATVLAAHSVLIDFGLDVTVLATAATAVVLAVGLWVTHPPGRASPAFSWRDRGSWTELVGSVFVEPARALRNPFFVAVAAVYGFSAMMLGSFDELWPHALEHAHAPAWLEVVLNYGLIAGDLVLLAVAWLGDLVSRRTGEQQDFLVKRARTFTLGMAALMFLGAASVTLTEHLFGVPAVGIGINAFAGEAGSVGMVLAVNALLKQHIADRREREHVNNMAQQLKALAMLLPGAALAGSTWAGATPGLPSGWAGVSVQIGVAGAAMLVAALAVLLWQHRGGGDGGRLPGSALIMGNLCATLPRRHDPAGVPQSLSSSDTGACPAGGSPPSVAEKSANSTF